MMKMMLGFFSCARGLDVGSAKAIGSAASAAPSDQIVRDNFIGVSSLLGFPRAV